MEENPDTVVAFWGLQKPIAAICYGVAALVFARDSGNHIPILRGKHVTGHCLEYDYLDGTVVKGLWDSQVEPVSILVAFGIDESGYRHVSGVEAGCVGLK